MAIITKTLLSNISNYRLDAQYYDPSQLLLEKQLLFSGYKTLFHLADVNGGKRLPKGEGFVESGFPYVRVVDIQNGFIDNSKVVSISEEIWRVISNYNLKLDDVLVTIVGNTVGLSGILSYDLGIANFTENCARIRNAKIDPYYILAFLISKYGQNQVDREKVGTSQPKLSLDRLRRFKIFCPKEIELKDISNMVKLSAESISLSQFHYKKAISILEYELGLDKVTFEKKKSYAASFSEVATTRRMNAEYFSPLVKKILCQSFLINSKPIGSLFQIIRGNSPKQYFDNGFPVIKTKNIRVPEIDRERVSDFVQTTKDLTTIQENDLLLASMGVGSLGRMSYILSLDEDTVVDGTIRVFRRKSSTPINYEIPTLLFLSTKVGQELIYRGIVGSTGIISLPDDYLSKIPIPHFPEDLCLELTRLVKESMMAKRESKRLLEEAKTRVEQLIEEAANK
jgi:type I restriction enzyme S subunit